MIRVAEGIVQYPAMEHGFPRRYVDQTPQEILYDPTRILGFMCPLPTRQSLGRTVLRQPRRESTLYREISGAGTHGKPGPVVLVSSPEAAQAVRDMYPGETYTVAFGEPPGAGFSKIPIKHTDELKVGDRVYITFPRFSRGFLVFGNEETLAVVRAEPGKGVWFVDESGNPPSKIPQPLYGTYGELVGKLKELTSVGVVEIYRPIGKPPSPQPQPQPNVEDDTPEVVLVIALTAFAALSTIKGWLRTGRIGLLIAGLLFATAGTVYLGRKGGILKS